MNYATSYSSPTIVVARCDGGPCDNRPQLDADSIQEEWEAALQHAGLTSEECVLFLSDLPSRTGLGAQWWEPGMTIEADDDLVTEELAVEANSPQHRNSHRVIVRRPPNSDPISIAALSGKLRHELEHARQFECCGPSVGDLSALADRVLHPKIAGLVGGNVFTHVKPNEQDANAAAAMFLRKRWPKEITALLSDCDHAPLVRSLTPPGSPETLVKRTVAFLYLYEDLCRALRGDEQWTSLFGDELDHLAPGAGELWQTLDSTEIPGWRSGRRRRH